jgi:hypothetical protein
MPGTVGKLTAFVALCEALIMQIDALGDLPHAAPLREELRGASDRAREQLRWLREPLDSRRGDPPWSRWSSPAYTIPGGSSGRPGAGNRAR